MAEVSPALSVQHLRPLQELGQRRGILGVRALDHVLRVNRRVKAALQGKWCKTDQPGVLGGRVGGAWRTRVLLVLVN